MAKVVTPLVCEVQAIGKPRESRYEPGTHYHSTLFRDIGQPQEDESSKIWKNLSSAEAQQLCVGDRVQLIPVGTDKSGKPKHNIVLLDAAPSSAEAAPTVPAASPLPGDGAPIMSAQDKQAIATYVQEMAKLYGYCFGQATTELGDKYKLSESSLRCVASSLFIAVQKRFQL